MSRQIHHAEEYGQLIVNYDEKGKIVKVELLNASKLLGGFLTEIIRAPERKI